MLAAQLPDHRRPACGRKHADVNGGREIVATRWIDPDGTLVTKQDWGGRCARFIPNRLL